MRVVAIASELSEQRGTSYVYELVAAHELPEIDLFKSLRSVL